MQKTYQFIHVFKDMSRSHKTADKCFSFHYAVSASEFYSILNVLLSQCILCLLIDFHIYVCVL